MKPNKLGELRTTLGLKQPEVAMILRTAEPRIDAGMISRYEKGVCLPTKEQLPLLETLYRSDRTEIYDSADLDLLRCEICLSKNAVLIPSTYTQSAEKSTSVSCKIARARNIDTHKVKGRMSFRLGEIRREKLRKMYREDGFESDQEFLTYIAILYMASKEKSAEAGRNGRDAS